MPGQIEIPDVQWTPDQSQAELVREVNERLREIQIFLNPILVAIDEQFDLLEGLVLTRTGEFSYRNNQETILGTINIGNARLARIGLLAPTSTPNVSQLRIGSNTSPVTSPPIVGASLTTSYQFFEVISGGELAVGDTIGLTLTAGQNNADFVSVLTLALDDQPFD